VIWNRLTGRATRAVVTLSTCAIVLAACGREAEDAPTPAPAPSSTPLLNLTPQASTATPHNAVSPVPAASPVAGDPTVGDLADRIAAAWNGVTSYRATFTSFESVPDASPVPSVGTSPIASPVAGGVERVVVDEFILPNQRRRAETVGGQVVSEIVLVHEVVYLRGVVPKGMAGTPVVDPNEWVTLDATLPADSPYRALYDEITAPPAPPYSALSQDERERIAHPIGETIVAGRTCTAYRIAETSNIGERLDVMIALDENDLPCSIETRASGTSQPIGTTVFEFNLPLTITAPV
jgi:hypothetical protein